MTEHTAPHGVQRALIVGCLIAASAGALVPFGLSSDKGTNVVSALEWVLAGLALVAVVGLALELTGRVHAPWPLMVTGFVWAVITVYVCLGPDATFLWHLAHALIAAPYAVLALTTWRLVARGAP